MGFHNKKNPKQINAWGNKNLIVMEDKIK